MKIEFIGVGEAFEPELGNASYLVHSDTKLLVDCGYGVPRNLFLRNYAADMIDAVYITHFHADHCFGMPPLLNSWNQEGRRKRLTIIGQPGSKELMTQVIELGYPNCLKKLQYELEYIETVEPFFLNELELSFAKTDHPLSNYAVKIKKGEVSLGISGDGGLTEDTRALFQDCTHLIHEAFKYEDIFKGHTDALSVVEYAKTLPHLKLLALVHIQRDERVIKAKEFAQLIERVPFQLLIPSPGVVIMFRV